MPFTSRRRARNEHSIANERLRNRFDEHGNLRVRHAPLNYVEVEDDEDDGQFPHRLHREWPHFHRMREAKKEEMREAGIKFRVGKFR